ncbi:MAG: M48 family metalloprotease [Acidovorax sp.]
MRDFKSFWPLAHAGRALAASLLIAFGATQAQAQARLPTLGDGNELTTGAERKLGDSIIRQLYRDPDYVDDAPLQEYVQNIFQALVTAARARGELSPELDERFAWEILLGRDRTVNAFALPGGYMGVHLGLIGVVASRDELASVMAHELSHITQRHIARLMAQEKRQTPLMLAAMVLGALAASKSPNAASALMVGGPALVVQNQLNFSRDMEREADRVGYGLMQPAGFAPEGFVSMFDKLQQANRLNDNGSWPYLRSHPLTTQRIADMHSRLPPGQTSVPQPVPTVEHAMLAARARVLTRPGVDVLRQWVTEPQTSGFATRPLPQRAAVLYASALGYEKLSDFANARRMAAQLRDTVQGDAAALRQARLLAAEVELAAGQPQAALEQLPAVSGARPELTLRSQALLRLHHGGDATGPLQTWLATHPHDATLWQLLASCWQQQNQPLRAVRAEAEAQAAHYDWAAAVDRFKAGQDMARKSGAANDYIEASIIDTRLREAQDKLKEQKDAEKER